MALKVEGQDYFDDFDTSDEEEIQNSVGNVPMSWYEDYPHIGYTQDGTKIFKPAKGNELDEFLDKMENPDYWRKVKDTQTGRDVLLTEAELTSIKKIISHNYTLTNDTYEPWVDFFTNEVMIHPLINTVRSKKSFIPSLSEKEKVQKLVYAMRMGWIKHKKPKNYDDDEPFNQDLWKPSDSEDIQSKRDLLRMRHYIPAPKPALPHHQESYNPPLEYLFDEKEKEKWLTQDPEDRRINFIPQHYSSLRHVPSYENFILEQYERCLDLYLCPRVRKMKANLSSSKDLLPTLPKPEDLRPFPSNLAITYRGHTGPVTCIAVDTLYNHRYLLSGSKDSNIRIWEISTGRCLKTLRFTGPQMKSLSQDSVNNTANEKQELKDNVSLLNANIDNCTQMPVNSVAWCPIESKFGSFPLIAIAIGSYVFIIALPKLIMGRIFSPQKTIKPKNNEEDLNKETVKLAKDYKSTNESEKNKFETLFKMAWSSVLASEKTNAYKENSDSDQDELDKKETPKSVVTWIKPNKDFRELGIVYILKHSKEVTKIEWHKGGDYILSVCAKNGSESIILNKLSRRESQAPFKKIKGIILNATFHPKAPILFVSTQKYIKIYNLMRKELSKILMTSCKWVSSIAIHPGGDNLIAGSYDNKVVWFDLDLSTKPYKTLKFHSSAVRSVAYHPKQPLFASASEDCSIIISHGMVYNDFIQNPLIVPVKILKGHQKMPGGVYSCVFHNQQPWIFSAGADGNIHLYSS